MCLSRNFDMKALDVKTTYADSGLALFWTSFMLFIYRVPLHSLRHALGTVSRALYIHIDIRIDGRSLGQYCLILSRGVIPVPTLQVFLSWHSSEKYCVCLHKSLQLPVIMSIFRHGPNPHVQFRQCDIINPLQTLPITRCRYSERTSHLDYELTRVNSSR